MKGAVESRNKPLCLSPSELRHKAFRQAKFNQRSCLAIEARRGELEREIGGNRLVRRGNNRERASESGGCAAEGIIIGGARSVAGGQKMECIDCDVWR